MLNDSSSIFNFTLLEQITQYCDKKFSNFIFYQILVNFLVRATIKEPIFKLISLICISN